MKKIFTFFVLVASSHFYSQSTFNLYQGGTVNAVSNGTIINETTAANNESIITIKLKNTSASTQTYTVKRTIQYNVPTLDVSGNPSTPETYFCFGFACFGNNVNEPTSDDYTILLAAGQTATTLPYSDDSDLNGTPFKIYLKEGSSTGKYFVYYKVYNVNNANDSISFTVKYNEFLGVNSVQGPIESVSEIHPNPTTTSAYLAISLKHEAEVKANVYNVLGALVSSSSQKYSPGKHKLFLDCKSLNNGLYFIKITSGESVTTKRLIIDK